MKDYVIKATSGNGQVRAYVGITKNLVQTARDNHNTIKVATAALGRTLTATTMMGLMMKNDNDELSVIIKGGGPIGTILTTADSKGNVKGYVQYPDLNGVQVEDYPNGKLNVAGAVGKEGYVKVIKDLGLREPYVGSYPLVSGEIAEDFTHYFALSEQTPSVVSLGVLTTETTVEQAGGLIVQLMPDATEETIATLEQNVAKLKSVTTMLSEGMTPDDILNVVLEGLDPKILDICDVKFDCNCSKERIKKVLISLGRETLTEIIEEDKQAEISCHFCNSAYHYTEEELREILAEM
ncbi:MAG: Hsp33 family molecular chaperone HslO [Clostridiales bacterium]|uniref:Hsp33 family molecular chaperone HslO n=1 Tax=Terrisporobacter sp. TaxID=1965305 RepID=UPI002A540DB0|nr:Hsp33 family molecular chaperone HslO [Terrisporobacter sp.]MCI7205957.1 Hsp33 family molecular chaperone HslO [Clostridium sp.]MDD7757076.1 Hsp33 family molecular chaperone HslO [Clostridiales bacterium]MDY4135961.1 Hsp33 family molecular chaperone HslO [Terrisporobacter sp.]MDY4736116.1 Hsp33 family molecular chaperone HslO [Terrisporobacter sp.]MDY6152507.1 Hsp33 family molecular chaperone HslO [Terrisporobacter sp.]